jgi:hypothetical protein
MKLFPQVFASLVSALIAISQSTIATYVYAAPRVDIKARYVASGFVHKNPSHIIIAGLKNYSASSKQPIVSMSSGIKTIVMENEKTYHCHARGSEKIEKGQSNFRCELMRQDNINNPYDYVTTNKIVNLSCLGKLTGGIEYDEGTVYKFLMTCRKPLKKSITQDTLVHIGNIKDVDSSGPACWYWRVGKKGKDKTVLNTWAISGGSAVININGNDTKLKTVIPWKIYSLDSIKIQVKTKTYTSSDSDITNKGTVVISDGTKSQTIKVEGYCGV